MGIKVISTLTAYKPLEREEKKKKIKGKNFGDPETEEEREKERNSKFFLLIFDSFLKYDRMDKAAQNGIWVGVFVACLFSLLHPGTPILSLFSQFDSWDA